MSVPPSKIVLPRYIDPRKLVLQGAKLAGQVPSGAMPRLASVVADIQSDAVAELEFDRDEQGRYLVSGTVNIYVALKCQRCLENLDSELSARFRLAVVWTEEQSRQLPEQIDPWIVDADSADLAGLLEEELLLALPIVSFHRESECAAAIGYSTGEPAEPAANPFSVLKQWKKPG